MSGDHQDLQELLVELEYGELDVADREAAQARIDEHPELVRMQQAFRAVREDLSAWDEIEGQPARIAFVTMPGEGRSTGTVFGGGTTFGWMKGAAMAASFVFGILLAAAFASTSLTRTETGWTFSTGFSRAAAPSPAEPSPTERSPAQPGSQPTAANSIGNPSAGQASLGQVPVGTVPSGSVPSGPSSNSPVGSSPVMGTVSGGMSVSGGQAQPFRMSRRQFGIDPMLVGAAGDREQQLRALVREMVTAAEQRQRQQMDSLLTDLYQTFDTQRTSDLSVVFDELGLLRSSTGLELQRTNEVIDFLVTRMGSDLEVQVPEQRDDD